MTVAEWLDSYCKDGYKPGDDMPVMVKVEGEVIEESEWPLFYFRPRDHVEVRVAPRGADPFSITVALFAGVKAVLGFLQPQLPGTPNVPGQGDQLAQGSVRGNKVKLGDPVREAFGTNKIYPDYLLPNRKYFSSPRVQQTRFCMNVGVGAFQINALNVRIGETPFLALGAEADYQIFQPDEWVGSHPSAQWWHTAPEVGASSTGAAGLELTVSTAYTPNVVASAMTFNAYTVTIPTGAGVFPSDWVPGLTIRMVVPYNYTVTDGGGAARDVITGPLAMLNPTVGDSIEIAGANAGLYTVAGYSAGNLTLDFVGGAPANSLLTGTALACIGPAGLRYKIISISPSSMVVQRLTASGSPDVGFPGFTANTTSAAVIGIDSASLEGGWRGPFPACPLGEKTLLIEWDMFFPEGLCGVGREGQVYPRNIIYEVQYRDSALGGAWTSNSYTIVESTLDQIGFTVQLDMPYPMRPEVRMRLLDPLNDNLEWRDTVQWLALKCRLTAPATYPGCTVICGRVQIADRISGQTESQVNIIGTRILPIRRGGNWQPPQPTREIAPPLIYMLKSLGMTDADFDFEEIDRLSDGPWLSRVDRYDYAVTEERTAKDLANEMLACGFAELTIDDGLVRPVRDEPRTTLEHAYSAQNMTQELSIDSNLKSNNDFDGVQVTYQDSDTWTEEVVECRLPADPVSGIRVEKITAPGITNRNKAYQYGMRRRRVHEYRRDSYSFATPGDALNSRYLSFCAASADIPGYGQSALLRGVEAVGGGAYNLTSGEPLDWSAPGPYMAALRKLDGTVSGPYVVTRINDYAFRVPSLDFSPEIDWADNLDPPHILFGPVVSWAYKILVTSVTPQGSTGASVEAVGYDDRVYLSDNATAP